MKSDWEQRYREAEAAWGQLKSYTKRVRLDGQTPEYRELSNLIHSLGREVFYVNADDYDQTQAEKFGEQMLENLRTNVAEDKHRRGGS